MIVGPDTPNLPPLPQLQGEDALDLSLAVFTHRSVSPPQNVFQPGFGDAERLTELGSQALRLAVTRFYFRFQPLLSSQHLMMKVREMTEGPSIDTWLDAYGLKQRLSLLPTSGEEILSNNHEMARFLYTYVGAIYYCSGPQTVDQWIFAFLNLTEAVKVEDVDMDLGGAPPDYAPAQPQSPPPPQPHPPSSPPMDGSGASPSNSVTNAHLITLALVNETAAKRGIKLDYHQLRTGGQDHTPMWTVKCMVDGVERGSGTSSKTKVAREEAARQAFIAMHWP